MSDLNTFSRELDRAFEKNFKLSEQIVRKVAFDGHREIVRQTPKDTGRAQANWQIEINGANDSEVDSVSPPDEERDKLSSVKLGDVIHIFNNVEYILPLEFDHASKQVPASGWVRSEAIRMENKLSEALKAI